MGHDVTRLLIFLLFLRVLSSTIHTTYKQNDTMVCTGRQALFRWKCDIKPFFGVVWTHNGSKMASSKSLLLSPKTIISEQFKGRLNFRSRKPFSFTLDTATQEDNGMYECIFMFDDGNTSTLVGQLMVKDFRYDDSLEKMEEKDRCVTLSNRANHSCTWTYPNGTKQVAKTIHYCSKKANETIRCESVSEDICTYANYTSCNKSKTKRQRRSSGGTDPINPVHIVVGVLVPIIAIAVITVIIVFYKRRSGTPREEEPPGSDNLVPVKDDKE